MEDHFKSAYSLKENISYEKNGTTYTTNENGNIAKFSGQPTLESAPRSPSSQRNLDGKTPGYHAGHLVASSNGGSGKVDNLVPMDGKVNTRDYRAMERENNDLLKDGKTVTLHGELSYSNGSSCPDAIMVTRETTDPGTGKVDTEHMSWTNTDMAEFENSGEWASLADEYDNPGAVIADDQGNVLTDAQSSFNDDVAAAAQDTLGDEADDGQSAEDGQDPGSPSQDDGQEE